MRIFIIERLETNNFDMIYKNYGFFSSREKAEHELRLLEQQAAAGQIFCLDVHPRPFEIREVELDVGAQSYICAE